MNPKYSYTLFHEARNPRLTVAAAEYMQMRVNLNQFMHDMLKDLKGNEQLLGKTVEFKRFKLLAFLILLGASISGALFFQHPGWISFSVFCGIVLAVAVLAVPITFLQDAGKYRKQRDIFVSEVKSYYMFQYSLMHKAGSYEEYSEAVPDADTGVFLRYLEKYKE